MTEKDTVKDREEKHERNIIFSFHAKKNNNPLRWNIRRWFAVGRSGFGSRITRRFAISGDWGWGLVETGLFVVDVFQWRPQEVSLLR